MAELYDITHWNPQPWYSTGGTRAKKYVQSPKGEYYYFKRSQLKPGKDYKYEFWSEIIAYEVGRCLKFNVLRYDIAIDGDIMGCISKTMIDPDKEDLIEGIKYLQAFDNSFAPENTALRKLYTFQLIEKALRFFGLEKFVEQIVEIILFDSIIGNSDRHQENWAFINDYSVMGQLARSSPDLAKILEPWRMANELPKGMAPIYDNGSSLGRELSEEKVIQLLENKNLLVGYIEKGTAEIHWNNRKLAHFDLIRALHNSTYSQKVGEIVNRVGQAVQEVNLNSIVNQIDNLVPQSLGHYRLPTYRKQLIINIVSLRIAKLLELFNEGI